MRFVAWQLPVHTNFLTYCNKYIIITFTCYFLLHCLSFLFAGQCCQTWWMTLRWRTRHALIWSLCFTLAMYFLTSLVGECHTASLHLHYSKDSFVNTFRGFIYYCLVPCTEACNSMNYIQLMRWVYILWGGMGWQAIMW